MISFLKSIFSKKALGRNIFKKGIAIISVFSLVFLDVITPLAVGVNDSSKYITRSEYEAAMSDLKVDMAELQASYDYEIGDSVLSYFTDNNSLKAGTGMKVESVERRNVLSGDGVEYEKIEDKISSRSTIYQKLQSSDSEKGFYNVVITKEESPTGKEDSFLAEAVKINKRADGGTANEAGITVMNADTNETFASYSKDGGITWSKWEQVLLTQSRKPILMDFSKGEVIATESFIYGDAIYFPYTGSPQEYTLYKGHYRLEVWGAQGGYRSNSAKAGLGGYSTGIISITEPTTVYVYAGGSGITGKTSGGWNGGGGRYGINSSGGGGSDISLKGGNWDSADHLNSRIIVAGGGGSDGSTSRKGGNGGGLNGENGGGGVGSHFKGGTQTGNAESGWTRASQLKDNTNESTKPGFGFGGYGVYYAGGYGGGGGGGWWGGAGCYPDGSGDDDSGGGGGSGYVYSDLTHANHPNDANLGSKYYFDYTKLCSGKDTFLLPTSFDKTENGHTGDGACRITLVDPNNISSDQAIITQDTVFYDVNSWVYPPSPTKIKAGVVFNFPYAGTQKSVTLPEGRYKLEVWGAQGGTGRVYVGGKGGYSSGILTLNDDTIIYSYVGGSGSSYTSSQSNYTYLAGGYNGGGFTYSYSYGGTGGGGTDFRVGGTNYKDRIIVAGGGAGSGYYSMGGGGGGENGGETENKGTYGRQDKGGIAYNSGGNYITPQNGGFGYGGGGCGWSDGGSGGGGGWYGGAGDGWYGWGGGGSGYVLTKETHKYSDIARGTDPAIDASYYLTEAKTIVGDGNYAFPTTTYGSTDTEKGHSGSGYARITCISSIYG